MTDPTDPLLAQLAADAKAVGGVIEQRIIGIGWADKILLEPGPDFVLALHDSVDVVRHFIGLNPRFHAVGSRRQPSGLAAVHVAGVDVDPCTPFPNVPATESERGEAAKLADELAAYLESRRYGTPWMVLDTGNGNRLLYRIPRVDRDLIPAFTRGFKTWTRRLAERFAREYATIDAGVANAQALVPVPGSWNRKGTPSDDRSHRRVNIVRVGDDRPSASLRAEILAGAAFGPRIHDPRRDLTLLPCDPDRMALCPLVAFMIGQARLTRQLRHVERRVLGCLGNALGDAGRAWVHRVLCITWGYSIRKTNIQLRYLNETPYKCETITRILHDLHGSAAPQPCRIRPPACQQGAPTPVKLAREGISS